MTERQKLVLEFIKTYWDMKGHAPSMQDIATGLNMKSRSNIHRIIHDLRNPAMSIIFGLQESIEALANELKNDGIG